MTYTTLDGRVLDLGNLTDEERSFFDRCVAAYRQGVAWEDFANLVGGAENPLLRSTGGRVTRAVWEHPLYQALRDLEERLGIQQGKLEPEGVDEQAAASDPLEDEWLPAPDAAAVKGVTLPGLHKAIRRGDVLARRWGNGRVLVSRRSLERWEVNRTRQAARRSW